MYDCYNFDNLVYFKILVVEFYYGGNSVFLDLEE